MAGCRGGSGADSVHVSVGPGGCGGTTPVRPVSVSKATVLPRISAALVTGSCGHRCLNTPLCSCRQLPYGNCQVRVPGRQGRVQSRPRIRARRIPRVRARLILGTYSPVRTVPPASRPAREAL
jgi:hypothetical protein